MAGLLIVAVKYSSDEAPSIEKVKARFLIKKEKGGLALSTENVVLSVESMRGILRAGEMEVKTAIKNIEGRWSIGAKVGLYGDGYITTDPNEKSRDNLGNLPEI